MTRLERPTIDEARLSTRYRRRQLEADSERRIAKALRGRDRAPHHPNGPIPQGDPADLRGIPCIARGVGGTSPGTAPHTAILRNDR